MSHSATSLPCRTLRTSPPYATARIVVFCFAAHRQQGAGPYGAIASRVKVTLKWQAILLRRTAPQSCCHCASPCVYACGARGPALRRCATPGHVAGCADSNRCAHIRARIATVPPAARPDAAQAMNESAMILQGFTGMSMAAAPCLAQGLPLPLPMPAYPAPFTAPFLMPPFPPVPDLSSMWMLGFGMGVPALCAMPPPMLPAPAHLLPYHTPPPPIKPRPASKKLVAPTRPRRGRLGRSTFANMIEDALKAADSRWVSLSYIYKHFATNLQHVIAAHPKWQDCVRRTLCINRNRFVHQPHQLGMTHGGMWGLCDRDGSSSKSASERPSGCSTPSPAHVSKALHVAVVTSSASCASDGSADLTPVAECKTDMAAILLSLNPSPLDRGSTQRDEGSA